MRDGWTGGIGFLGSRDFLALAMLPGEMRCVAEARSSHRYGTVDWMPGQSARDYDTCGGDVEARISEIKKG